MKLYMLMCPTQQTALLLYAHVIRCHTDPLSRYQLLLLVCHFYFNTVFLKSLSSSHLDNCSDFLKDFAPVRELGETASYSGVLKTTQLPLKHHLGKLNLKTLYLSSLLKEEAV